MTGTQTFQNPSKDVEKFETEPEQTKQKGCNWYIVLGTVVVISSCVLLGIVFSMQPWRTPNPARKNEQKQMVQSRIDCYPESEGGVQLVDEDTCLERGCLWDPVEEDDEGAPWCYFPQDDTYGYRVSAGPEDTEFGQRWTLEALTSDGPFGPCIQNLYFDVEYRSDQVLRFTLDDANDERYRVPMDLNLGDGSTEQPMYTVDVYNEDPFTFRILRTDNGAVLWDTGAAGLVYSPQYLQIATRLPTANIYGFGEHAHRSFRHEMNYQTWPIWGRDQPPHSDAIINDGANFNLYGAQTFYELVEEGGQTHGVFLHNSNEIDVTLTPAPMLVYKSIGGILDFYMFMGPTPEEVVQQYTGAVGLPYMPPYWSLGFQMCRYGYENTQHMREVMQRTEEYGIPCDVQYADIDHMDRQRDFTLDPINFPDLGQYFDELRSRGYKTVVILDPALEINDTYPPYVRGKEVDGYIRWPSRESMPPGDFEEYNSTDMMGYVWPEWKTVFPDFFNPDMGALWTDLVVEFRTDTVPFDALWIDMNEPANFDTNKDKIWNWPDDRLPYWSLKCPVTDLDDPPYRTKASYMYDNPDEEPPLAERLSGKTICLQGVQSGYTQYDVHNLYGWQQSIVSLDSIRSAVAAAEGVHKRSLVVTRSSYAGTGSYAGTWLGDNTSAWPDMWLSIIGMLDFNLFGFPYIGADICGFFEDTTPQLCRRWHELGAFYTYSRNHNGIGWAEQDPGYFGDEVAIPTRDVMLIRYRILPYLYTLFHKSHTEGGTVIRPLFHEFPADSDTYGIDRQFMWGPAFLINPILEENQEELDYYLPAGRWFDYYTGGVLSENGGEQIEVEIEEDTPIQLALRGGYIIPSQQPANMTAFSRMNPFGLIVALDAQNEAEGLLFWDDGDSIDTYENGNYYTAKFQCNSIGNSGTLDMVVDFNNVPELDGRTLDDIEILGEAEVTRVFINSEEHTDFEYEDGVLRISNAGLLMTQNNNVEWS